METSHIQGQTIRIWCTVLPSFSNLTLTNNTQTKKCGKFSKYPRIYITLRIQGMILVITATTNFALLRNGLLCSSLVTIAYTGIIYKVTHRKCSYNFRIMRYNQSRSEAMHILHLCNTLICNLFIFFFHC
jgi:hypothetical protein